MWTAEWSTQAMIQLQALVDDLAEGERPALIQAVNRITERLAAEGDRAGESRVTQFRILIESPLAVYFWAGRDEYLDVATVTKVWLWRSDRTPGER